MGEEVRSGGMFMNLPAGPGLGEVRPRMIDKVTGGMQVWLGV
jgi:hypothetical protein